MPVPVKSSSICAGVSVLSKLNPLSVPPGARRLVVVVHRTALPEFVTVSVHPVGEITLVGVADRNPAPGTHPNQKVPIVVVPVLSKVIE
jgi:hypothetical protein